jgi:DNA-binding HxlR family transcriptional regulator
LDLTHKDVRVPDPNAAGCRALAEILARIGDKWTVLVVGALSNGPQRYNALRRMIDGISQRMLTLTLKGLEQDGLVTRTLYPTVPPRVDYELTELGRSLIGTLGAVFEWAQANRGAMLAARAAYEARGETEPAGERATSTGRAA